MITFLTSEESTAELSRVNPVNCDKAASSRFPYNALSSDDFERLLYSLYQKRTGREAGYDNLRLMIYGADQGRDVWLTLDEIPVGLVQCKRVKQGFSAPSAMREVIKFLLFAELEPELLPNPSKFCFTLAVSADPADTTATMFQTPKKWIEENKKKIPGYIDDLRKKYSSFSEIDTKTVFPKILDRLIALKYKLIRPVDLDGLLEESPSVNRRFFKAHIVIGLDEAEAMIENQFAKAGFSPPLALATISAKEDVARGSRTLAEWPKDIWGKHINRPELKQLVQRIDQNKAGATLVVGGAGTGKSALLAELYGLLEKRGQAVLAIKADILSSEITDLDGLARDLKLEGSIEARLRTLAAETSVVLIIDQLDAVSEVMDQSSNRMQVLLQLATGLQEAKEADSAPPPIHIVVSSRPFEARFDARFKQLKADEIKLSLPPLEHVEKLLTDLNLDHTTIPNTLKEMIRTPFALKLYVDLVKVGTELSDLTPANLLDRWLDKKLPTGEARVHFIDFLRSLAADMTNHESMWRPASHYEPEHSKFVRMAEAVGLVIRDGVNIGFSHQSWLDDFQAKTIRTGEALAEFAWKRQDALFARGTVLRGLEYLRRNDSSAYEQALQMLLRTPHTRRHLQHLVVDFLASGTSPSEREIAWIGWLVRHDRPLANRALSKVALNWQAWRNGLTPLLPFLMQNEQHRWNSTMLLIREAEEDAGAVMDLIDRYWPEEDRDADVFTVFDRSAIVTPRIIDRARTIFIRTRIDEFYVSHYATVLLMTQHVETAIKLVATWAETQTEDRYNSVKLHDLEKLSSASPLLFAQTFLPWFVSTASRELSDGLLDRRYPHSRSLSYDWDDEHEQGRIVDVLRSALADIARTHPQETRSLLKTVFSIEIDEVQSLIADTFAENPHAFQADALTFLLGDNRRLDLGREGSAPTLYGWSSKNLIEKIAPVLSSDEIATLRDYLETWMAWDKSLAGEMSPSQRLRVKRWSEDSRLRLLAELPQSALTPRRRRQVAEWRFKQPKVSGKTRGKPMAMFIGSPMSTEQMLRAQDDDLIKLFDEVHDGTDHHPRDWMRGGVLQLSQAFADFAKAAPKRAIDLIRHRLQVTRHEEVAGAAIRELARLEHQNTATLKALVWELHERGFTSESFHQDAAAALEDIARKLNGLEVTDINLLRSWLQRDQDVLAKEAKDHADLRRINRENNEKSNQEPSALLFHRRGGSHIIPQRNFTILSAITAGYLSRDDVDYNGWLAELETHVGYAEDPEIWTGVLLRYSRFLLAADTWRVITLLDEIWRKFPNAFDDPDIVIPLWHLRSRLSIETQQKIGARWLQHEDYRLRQAAGEFAAACAIVAKDNTPETFLAVDNLLNHTEVNYRVGVLFSAGAGWRETLYQIRGRSHRLLLSAAPLAQGPIARAISSAVDKGHRLEPDELTRELLNAINENDELLLTSINRLSIVSLQGLLLHPGFEELVLEISEHTTRLALASTKKTIGGLYNGELVSLAVTLQRSPTALRGRAMTIYEQLLDAEVNGAEEAAAYALRR